METKHTGIHNPHDGFFKSLMADRDAAIAFLDEFLPEEVKSELDLQSLQPAGTTFVSKALKQYFSDIVFRLGLRQREESCYISLLLEHKSTPEDYVEFQLLAYIANGYQTLLKQDEKLSLIVPFVYYHGREKWRLKPLSAYFRHYPAAMHGYLPAFDKVFISLFDLSPAQIDQLGNAMLRAALLVQRHRYDPVELIRTWARISSTLAPYAAYNNFLRMTFVYVISISRMTMEQIKKVLESAPEQADAWVLELYEQISREWGEQAKMEGKIERSIEVVLNAHANGLAIPLISNITALDEAEVLRILKEHGKI